jgi:hypothetical protein
MLAAVLEPESGSCDEIPDRARDEHLTGSGERRDTRADRHRDPRQLAVAHLALTGVNPDADLELEPPKGVADRGGSPNRSCGPIERREEAISGRVELAPVVAPELLADDRVVSLQQLTPARIAEARCQLRRTDDVREEKSLPAPAPSRPGR